MSHVSVHVIRALVSFPDGRCVVGDLGMNIPLTLGFEKLRSEEMLQPTETDPPPDSLQPGVPHSSQVHGQGGRTVSEREGTLWRWISVKELVFIFLACSVGAALFRSRDNLNFDLAWQEPLDTKLYRNSKFPFDEEKL